MNLRQALFGVTGLCCLALGTVVRGVGTNVTEMFSGGGGDYVLVAGLSVLALIAAISVIFAGRESQLHQTETPDPEVPVDVPPAGSEFDETVRGWAFRTPVVGSQTRQQVKARLRNAAVESLMRAENCGRSRAQRLVRRGEWSDDTEATAFLGSSRQSVTNTMLKALPRRQTPAEYRARCAADAIHAVTDGDNG